MWLSESAVTEPILFLFVPWRWWWWSFFKFCHPYLHGLLLSDGVAPIQCGLDVLRHRGVRPNAVLFHLCNEIRLLELLRWPGVAAFQCTG